MRTSAYASKTLKTQRVPTATKKFNTLPTNPNFTEHDNFLDLYQSKKIKENNSNFYKSISLFTLTTRKSRKKFLDKFRPENRCHILYKIPFFTVLLTLCQIFSYFYFVTPESYYENSLNIDLYTNFDDSINSYFSENYLKFFLIFEPKTKFFTAIIYSFLNILILYPFEITFTSLYCFLIFLLSVLTSILSWFLLENDKILSNFDNFYLCILCFSLSELGSNFLEKHEELDADLSKCGYIFLKMFRFLIYLIFLVVLSGLCFYKYLVLDMVISHIFSAILIGHLLGWVATFNF